MLPRFRTHKKTLIFWVEVKERIIHLTSNSFPTFSTTLPNSPASCLATHPLLSQLQCLGTIQFACLVANVIGLLFPRKQTFIQVFKYRMNEFILKKLHLIQISIMLNKPSYWLALPPVALLLAQKPCLSTWQPYFLVWPSWSAGRPPYSTSLHGLPARQLSLQAWQLTSLPSLWVQQLDLPIRQLILPQQLDLHWQFGLLTTQLFQPD